MALVIRIFEPADHGLRRSHEPRELPLGQPCGDALVVDELRHLRIGSLTLDLGRTAHVAADVFAAENFYRVAATAFFRHRSILPVRVSSGVSGEPAGARPSLPAAGGSSPPAPGTGRGRCSRGPRAGGPSPGAGRASGRTSRRRGW